LINKSDDNIDCDYLIKASTIYEGDREELIDVILNPSLRKHWDFFLQDVNSTSNVNKTENFNVKFVLPTNDLMSTICKNYETPNNISIEIFKYIDNKKNIYIMFRQKKTSYPNSASLASNSEKIFINEFLLFELFVMVPIKDIDEEKTLIIFLTNYDHIKYNKNLISIPLFLRQKIKEERLNILGTLKEYISSNLFKLKKEDFEKIGDSPKNLNKNLSINFLPNKKVSFLNNLNKNDILINEDHSSSNNQTNSDLIMETVRSFKSFDNLEDDLEKIEQNNNPYSIITYGERISLEERFPGYLRNPQGGVECRNYEELSTQDGIILEVMKRAGKQLLEGKNIVSVSLPVRIFEARSTLHRISDNWGTGSKYFNKIANLSNPIERMKNYIAFAISGLHMGIKQLKPFNPILGETYQVRNN
jgi:hypothetical protein